MLPILQEADSGGSVSIEETMNTIACHLPPAVFPPLIPHPHSILIRGPGVQDT